MEMWDKMCNAGTRHNVYGVRSIRTYEVHMCILQILDLRQAALMRSVTVHQHGEFQEPLSKISRSVQPNI